ncbi:DUF2334 domain-containing protein [Desulforhopalus singaporensis]|uniref:Polysaccharide deacetylase n=1 Tax=Desulforhopalus singaporensis TaxID=91360 RepID=A0A1H0M6W1_9BACT|nr:hypothetical protein [Desulforhopalus singaporensis]SDO76228.1 hypothetical protein SAMN05660330_01008 [Desulforhopalus singaporensis]
MTRPVSPLYRDIPSTVSSMVSASIDRACGNADKHPLVFFRADDIGIPSRQFLRLAACFRKHRMPLCLAVVPSWVTASRFTELYRQLDKTNSQWCWHQHGATHRNYEPQGKKQEFGPSRNREDVEKSIAHGCRRLQEIVGDQFHKIFTPPWNRCSPASLQTLVELKFLAISRFGQPNSAAPCNLPDFYVNVDLHTRKEKDPRTALDNLLIELERGIMSGRCGIMIHHQRMNRAAFDLLDLLLEKIRYEKKLIPVTFRDLLQHPSG